MSENNTQDQTLELEQEEEVLEEEILEEEETEDIDSDEDQTELQKENEMLKAKLAKAEKAIVKNKKSSKTIKNQPKTNNNLSKDDIIFYSSLTQKGLTPDNIQQLEKTAEAFGLDRSEAIESPIFKAYMEQEKQRAVSEQASMGSSRGSRKAKKEASLADSNLDAETHKRLALERMRKQISG